MTRIVNVPEGSLRGLIARLSEEAEKKEQKAEPVGSQLAALMPVRKAG